MVRIQWINKEQFIEESGKTNVVIAAYTTAQARLQLYTYLESLVIVLYIVIQIQKYFAQNHAIGSLKLEIS